MAEGMEEEPVVVEDIDQFVNVFNTVFGSSLENLALLAKHCSVNTLRNFRLVSRQFRRASLDAWRNKATLRIDASAGLDVPPQPQPVARSEGQQHLFEELNRFIQHWEGPQRLIEELARLVRHPEGHRHAVLVGHIEGQQRLFEQLGRLVRRPGAQQRLLEELCRLVRRPEGHLRYFEELDLFVRYPECQQRLVEELGLLVRYPEGQQRLVEVLALLVPHPNHIALGIREFYEMIEDPGKDIFNLIDHPFTSYKLKLQRDENRTGQITAGVPPSSKVRQYFTDFGRKIHFLGGRPPGGYIAFLHARFRNAEKIVFEDSHFEPGLGLSALTDDTTLDNVTVIKIVNPKVRSVVLSEDEARRFQSVFPNLKIFTVTLHPINGFCRPGSLNEFRGWRNVPGDYPDNLVYYREIEDFLGVQTSPIEQLQIHVAPRYENYVADVLVATRLTLKGLILHRARDFEPINAFPFHVEFPSLEELQLWGGVTTNLNFLKWMPRLKKVVIEQDLSLNNRRVLSIFQENKVSKRPSSDFVENTYYLNLFVTMQHLVHLEIDDEIGKENWENLAEWDVLPMLQVLKTILNSASLGTICKNWRNLKQLSLMFGSDINEAVLTGIGKGLEMEGERLDIGHVPNLTDLKELTDFELMTYCGGGWSKITDFSVTHGFLEMPLLKKLIICASSEMTSGAEELLKAKIECVKVYRNDTFHRHEQINAEIKCCDKTAVRMRLPRY